MRLEQRKSSRSTLNTPGLVFGPCDQTGTSLTLCEMLLVMWCNNSCYIMHLVLSPMGFTLQLCSCDTVLLDKLVSAEEGLKDQRAAYSREQNKNPWYYRIMWWKKHFPIDLETVWQQYVLKSVGSFGLESKCWENHYSSLAPISQKKQ